MMNKPISETIFEKFCSLNNLSWEKIPECGQHTPDYKVVLNTEIVIVEVKQIDKDDKFTDELGSRTVGDRVREKINDKHTRRQVKVASKKRLPAILLIYNNLDPMQGFGTEELDFKAAMYGEPTVVYNLKENSLLTLTMGGTNRYDKTRTLHLVQLVYYIKLMEIRLFGYTRMLLRRIN